MRQVLGPGALGRPRGIVWKGRGEGGLAWGIHVTPWLIHVNVWQNPLKGCEVISLQLIKINEKKNKIKSSTSKKKKKKKPTRPTVLPCGQSCLNISPHLHSSYRLSSCKWSPVDHVLCLEMLRENRLEKSPIWTWELTWVIQQGILSCEDMIQARGKGWKTSRHHDLLTPAILSPLKNTVRKGGPCNPHRRTVLIT